MILRLSHLMERSFNFFKDLLQTVLMYEYISVQGELTVYYFYLQQTKRFMFVRFLKYV